MMQTIIVERIDQRLKHVGLPFELFEVRGTILSC